MCQTKRGCPIKPLARDFWATRKAQIFARTRLLLNREGYRETCARILAREELDDPTLLVQLEVVYSEHEKMLRDREQLEREAKRQAGIK